MYSSWLVLQVVYKLLHIAESDQWDEIIYFFSLLKSLQYVPNFEKIKCISGNLVFSLTTVRIPCFCISAPENNNNINNNNISNWKVSICTIKIMWALLHMAKFTECVTEVSNSCNLKKWIIAPTGISPRRRNPEEALY